MKRIFFIITLMLFVSVGVLAKTYKIELFSGNVRVSADNGATWRAATVEQTLSENYIIKTGANSFCEINMGARGVFRLSENSEIVLSTVKQNEEKLTLRIGRALFNIFTRTSDADTFAVESSIAVAAVRGTKFALEVTDTDQTTSVLEGSVGIVRNVNIPASGLLLEQLRSSLEVRAGANQELTVTLEENRQLEELMKRARNVSELRRQLNENRTFTQKRLRALENAKRLIDDMRTLDDEKYGDSEDAEALDNLIDRVRDR